MGSVVCSGLASDKDAIKQVIETRYLIDGYYDVSFFPIRSCNSPIETSMVEQHIHTMQEIARERIRKSFEGEQNQLSISSMGMNSKLDQDSNITSPLGFRYTNLEGLSQALR